ncbi:MAG: OB-fold nucleic acid binding domain-containing protein, partial [Bryobacteraceae bacterium]
EAIVRAQPIADIEDMARRVPELAKDELEQLAMIGALNSIGAEHRRNALWQGARASRPVGELLRAVEEPARESPLNRMRLEERLVADCDGIGMTLGPHPMAYRRAEMDKLRVTPAAALSSLPNGRWVRVAGNVIVRQRPGTAKGVTFMSLEDETGISNVVIMPDVFEAQWKDILSHPWVTVEGKLQNVDNVIHVLARRISPLMGLLEVSAEPHDFH